MKLFNIHLEFDMFGKSVIQMLHSSPSHETIVDELRAQVRHHQSEITEITKVFEELENRTFVKLQQCQTTVGTRDGIPWDNALNLMQEKMMSFDQRTSSHDETFENSIAH
jgi:hypothetical protein